jgi:L-2-hydroxyglutarate oxidase LhgO
MSSSDSPTFHRSNQSTNTFGSTKAHYHPNGGTCAFCDPSASTSTWPTRGMKRATSTCSFQTTMKRNTTIYAGDFAEPQSATDYTPTSKAATFPRLMRKKSVDMLKRKSQGWFRDLEAEEEEEAAKQRALVAAHEKEREAEMREMRERAERRKTFEEVDEEEEEEEDELKEPPPRLPELTLVSESEEEEGFDVLFGGIGR